jgi:hypothetical protein
MKQGDLSQLADYELAALKKLKAHVCKVSQDQSNINSLNELKNLIVQSRKFTLRQLHDWGIAAFTLDRINQKVFDAKVEYFRITHRVIPENLEALQGFGPESCFSM